MTAVLPRIDRAAFVTALQRRLRDAGVAVGPTAAADLVAALRHPFPRDLSELYWVTRVTMVSDRPEIPVFDRVFAAVFENAVLRLDPVTRSQQGAATPPEPPPPGGRVPDAGAGESDQGLPWVSRRELSPAEQGADDGHALPELRPSALEAASTLPFTELSAEQMAQLSRWVEQTTGWPWRPSRRMRPDPRGRRIALRRTLAQARRTGHELIFLARESRRRRPRRIVLVCDVSQSMQQVAAAHLHLMRALARQRRAEVFAFSTGLTRLTTTLRESTPEEALSAAADQVADRLGGTRISTSLRSLMDSHHGELLRGAVVVIASDGWDSDPPQQMAATMARLRRRAHTVVWLNPRAAAPDFVPGAGALVAALPHCDLMLPAHSFACLRDALEVVAGQRPAAGLSSTA
ncbi:MAG: CoxE [Acidobacteria bacterium]|nr:MAG: CoxE [Acidobacteriota bacterium]